jgi:hypothetical protein
MAAAGFCIPPSRRASNHRCMDAIAVILAIATFAILIALIFGIERI